MAQNPGVDLAAVDAAVQAVADGNTPDLSDPVFTKGSPENLAAIKQCRFFLTNTGAAKIAKDINDAAEKTYHLRMHFLFDPKVYPDVLPPGATYNP